MPVENSMEKPQHFLGCPSVLNITMTIVVSLYAIMGIFGYLRYGDLTASIITLNLDTSDPWVFNYLIFPEVSFFRNVKKVFNGCAVHSRRDSATLVSTTVTRVLTFICYSFQTRTSRENAYRPGNPFHLRSAVFRTSGNNLLVAEAKIQPPFRHRRGNRHPNCDGTAHQ